MGFIKQLTGFEIYSQKQRWKLYLLGFAAVIILASLYYTDILVRQIAHDERQRVELWADAIRKRETLLLESERLFADIQNEEEKRVKLLTEVYERLYREEDRDALTFYLNILQSNATIPLVLTNEAGEVISTANLDTKYAGYDRLSGELADRFSRYQPLSFAINGGYQYVYYQDSRVFTDLREVMDDLIDSFISDIVINSANVPVIVVDERQRELIAHGNIEGVNFDDDAQVAELIRSMAGKNRYLSVHLPIYGQCYVYYTNSLLLTQLRYYPLAQFLAIGIFLFVAYMLFSVARNAEQNQVWVGMSKETAHQLGTPLSSLMAWQELLKMKGVDQDTIGEMAKDLKRLENITERFSKIGSPPQLLVMDITSSVNEVVEYMRKRMSRKVSLKLAAPADPLIVPHNPSLFGWVIENIVKNAIDAMEGKGSIYITLEDAGKEVIVDISDDGKGIPASKQRAIFRPGFTSKKSGWGLGLSLSKRIVETYHGGKLFVKDSAINQGTTFRILLKKHPEEA